MGSAILRCLSQSDFAKFKDKSIWIYDKDFSKCKQLQKETDVNITSSAAELTEKVRHCYSGCQATACCRGLV